MGSKGGSALFRLRGWLSAAFLVPVGLLVIFSGTAVKTGPWPDLLMGALGWAAFIAGVGTRYWSTLYIGGRKSNQVVTEGPYSICRNPLYIGSLFISMSAVLLLRSLSLSACVAIACIVYAFGAVPAEERFLQQAHGEEFTRY